MATNCVLLFALPMLLGGIGMFSAPVPNHIRVRRDIPINTFQYGMSCGGHQNWTAHTQTLDSFKRSGLDISKPGKNLVCTETCRLGERRQMCVGHKDASLNYLSILKLTDDLCNVTSRFNASVCKKDQQKCPNETELHRRETEWCEDGISRERCLTKMMGSRLVLSNRAGETVTDLKEMKSCVTTHKKSTIFYDFLHGYEVTFRRKKKRFNCICLNGSWFCDKPGNEASEGKLTHPKKRASPMKGKPLSARVVMCQ